MNKGYAANYQIIVDRVNNSDTIEVQVEMTPEMFSDSMSEVTAKEKELVTALKAMLGIYAKVTLVNRKQLQEVKVRRYALSIREICINNVKMNGGVHYDG